MVQNQRPDELVARVTQTLRDVACAVRKAVEGIGNLSPLVLSPKLSCPPALLSADVDPSAGSSGNVIRNRSQLSVRLLDVQLK